jgi:hypothetical protein
VGRIGSSDFKPPKFGEKRETAKMNRQVTMSQSEQLAHVDKANQIERIRVLESALQQIANHLGRPIMQYGEDSIQLEESRKIIADCQEIAAKSLIAGAHR